ncbi:MAG: hypothetical protein JWQ40_626 [Segetibacter sp.]|nr:hypothetical protein [Segetibacter sp.]
MTSFEGIRKHVIDRLKKELSTDLTYHNVAHTLDVLEQVHEIALSEGIKDAENLLLLQTAALYHDIGFITVYTGHEERSCEIVRHELPVFGYTEGQTETICNLIKATKVPQKPRNVLEQIMCDADLDYLGRDDFFNIGTGLYKEFRDQKIVENDTEWNLLQIRFLEGHCYFTNTSKGRREAKKQKHLEVIKIKILT